MASLASQLAALSPADREKALAAIPADGLAVVLRHLQRESFAAFVQAAWPLVRPGDPLRWGWHLTAICEHLEAVHRGEIRKLLITICPGSAKSLLVEVFWPAWMWASDPTKQLVCLASDGDLALRDANRNRDLVKSDWYRGAFSQPAGWEFSASQDAKGYFENTAKGFRYSAGISGSVTGWRGHGVVMDDLLQAKDVLSKPARDAAVYALENVIPSRVNDPARGFFVMIQQRLCVDDPASWAIAQGDYEHLNLPTEFVPSKRYVTHRVVNGVREVFRSDPRKADGALLFPSLFTPAVVTAAKKNPEMYAAQHQQDPIPPGGGMFKIADWRFWKPDGAAPDHAASRPRGCYEGPANPLPTTWDRIQIHVDGTFKETRTGSYVAIHVWGSSGSRRCLLDRDHRRMDYDACERALVGERSRGRNLPIGGMLGRWPRYELLVVEDKANGSALVKRLADVLGIPRVLASAVNEGGKQQRASVFSLPYVRAGNAELPDGAPWLADYITEHAAFPLGKWNDDVDAQSQALAHLEHPITTAEIYMSMGPPIV